MNFSKFVFAALAGSFFLNSCSSDDNTNNSYTPLGKYDSGLLVLNQGGFGHGDAALSYVSYDYSTLENDIFSLNNNGLPLGDTAQDIGLKGSSAYIVVNGSNKIEVVNRYTMAHIATIDSGLSNPRYIAFTDQNKAYVTNWGDGLNADDDYVAIIDLASNLVTGTIQVSEGPERIIEYGGRLYVTHIGGFGFGNSISVINFATSSVSSIPVGDVPTGLYADNNVLWVSCA